MRLALAMFLFASVLAVGNAAAQSDPLQCRSYASQVAQAQNNRERLSELLSHPRASDCPHAAAQGRAYLRALTPPPTPGAVPGRADAGEPAAWQLAGRINSRAAYQAYIDQYPNGANAAEARRRIRVAAPQSVPGTTQTPAPDRAQREGARTGPQEFDDCNGDVWCPRMIVLPGGTFTMGSPESEVGRGLDEAQRTMSVRAFAVGKFEVTFQEWDECVRANACEQSDAAGGEGRERLPVTHVSWSYAQRYVGWLSQRTGRTYRLLSEAEWEYAARAGSTGRYSWGDDEPTCNEAARNGANGSWCQPPGTRRVGSFPPNAFGLHDMHGNVWEYVQDCYVPLSGLPADGRANVAGCDVNRGILGAGARGAVGVLRGGSFFEGTASARSAKRYFVYQSMKHRHIGFRVARDL